MAGSQRSGGDTGDVRDGEHVPGVPSSVEPRFTADRFPLGLCLIGEGRLRYCNRSFSRLFGYEPDELTSGTELRELGLEELSVLESVDAGAEESARPRILEGRTQSGETKHLEAYAVRAEHAGRPVVQVTLVDVTERIRRERAHREGEERSRLVLRATRNVIWDWDVRTNRISFNDVLCSAFRYRAEEVEQSYDWWLERVHPDDTRHVISGLEKITRQRGDLWTSEYRFRRGDGTYAVVLSRGYVTRGPDGAAIRLIGAMTDVTDYRQLEERFYRAQRMEAVGRLASGVAHDFNNALMVIQGTTDLLLSEAEMNDSTRSDLLEIRRAAERATALTGKLLAFGRRQVLRPEVVDLNKIVRDNQGMLAKVAGEDVRFVSRLAGDLSRVRVDRRQLEHALLNLVTNARDAMPHGGVVTLETADVELRAHDVLGFAYPVAPGSYVRLTVGDTGSGMDSETLAEVFEPFFTTKRKGKGTGLGLATVYGFVKQSGGYIWARSEPGQGSRFEIFLPRTEKKLSPVSRELDRPTLSGGGGRILLAEDEDAVRAITHRILSRAGYTVVDARNGLEAWQLFDQNPTAFDLLLTDVVMPEMGGRDLSDRVLAARPDVHVIYMSGQTDDRILHHGVGRRTVNFVQKPFRPEALLQKIQSLLRTPG